MFEEVVSAGCVCVADSPLGRVQAKSANLRSSQLRLQVESAASIAITAVSSKNNVTVSVQNSVVSPAIIITRVCRKNPPPIIAIVTRVLVLCFASTSVSAVRVFTGPICRIER